MSIENLTDFAEDRTRPLPDEVEVAIIGGGIVGAACAYFLARRGVPTVLCEKGRIGGEQSGRNWGWVRKQGRDAAELPIMIEAQSIWRGMASEMGIDVGYRERGCLYLARDEREMAMIEAWLPIAESHGLDTHAVAGQGLASILPDGAEDYVGGIYTPSDGRAEPELAAPALALAAEKAGARILTRCAVRGLDTQAGRVSAIVTERGTIRAGRVILAAGAWSRLFARSLGITVPQLMVRATVARTAPAPVVVEANTWAAHVAIGRRADGGYTVAHGSAVEHLITPSSFRFLRLFWPNLSTGRRHIKARFGRAFFDELRQPSSWPLDRESPFEANRMLHPEPNPRILAEIRRHLKATYPALGDLDFAETWAGMIEVSPDALPILSEVDRPRGLIIATGFSGHGFGLGPGAGRVLADLALGRETGHDLSPFRFSRFFDGSPIRASTGL